MSPTFPTEVMKVKRQQSVIAWHVIEKLLLAQLATHRWTH
jgi:hypothetical protein